VHYLAAEQFIRLANTLQRHDENARERLLPVPAIRGSFFCFCSVSESLDSHKKTRKRTATFSSGLLDIAAEDRKDFRLRSLALFVGDMCLLWRILKTGYIVGYANAKSP
jgi:hypothetical protein